MRMVNSDKNNKRKCEEKVSSDSEDEKPTKKTTKRRNISRKTKEPNLNCSDFNLNSISDLKGLIQFAVFLRDKYKRRKKVGVLRITECIDELEDLNNVIGLDDLKNQVTQQIMFFCLGLNDSEMMHTVISGPPGMAKTTVGKKIGLIYSKMGFLSEGHVISATRADLIGQYLGETSIKTQLLLEASIGGVLFIDEAYNLGSKDGKDSFATECINTINLFLSENSKNFMCIIAGYEKELKTMFFGANPGLERRFPWWFKLKPYSIDCLVDIFMYQIEIANWKRDESVDKPFIKNLINFQDKLFQNNGGDTLTLFDKCKISHSRRVFLEPPEQRKILTKLDMTEGFKLFKVMKISNGANGKMSDSMRAMYC